MNQGRLSTARMQYVRGLKAYIERNPERCLTAKRELECSDRTWARIEREGVQVSSDWIGIGIAARLLGISNTNESWTAYLKGASKVRGSLS